MSLKEEQLQKSSVLEQRSREIIQLKKRGKKD